MQSLETGLTEFQNNSKFFNSKSYKLFIYISVLFALKVWLKQQHKSFLWLSGAAILIFRAELSLFLGILLLLDIVRQRVSIITVIKTVLPAAVVLLGMVETFTDIH